MNEGDMSILTSLNMTTDASKSRLPTNTSTTGSSFNAPIIKTSEIITPQIPASLPKQPTPVPTKQPPVPQTMGRPPQTEITKPEPKLEEVNKLAQARNQLFNEENNDSQNESSNKLGVPRSRPKGNITMSFEKKTGGNVSIKHAAPLPPQQSPPSTSVAVNPQIVPKPAITSPEVSAFNPSKADSDKFKTVESSHTMRIPAHTDDTDRLQAEIIQLKTRINTLNLEHDDRLTDYDNKLKLQAKANEQLQIDLRRLQDEKKNFLFLRETISLQKMSWPL